MGCIGLLWDKGKGIGVPSNIDNKNFVVTGKDMSANHLIVAFEDENEQTLWGRKFMIKKISWVSSVTLATKARILAKARYRDPSTPVIFDPIDNDRAIIHFDKPQRALTPGQVLALYDGERLLGGFIVYRTKAEPPFQLDFIFVI